MDTHLVGGGRLYVYFIHTETCLNIPLLINNYFFLTELVSNTSMEWFNLRLNVLGALAELSKIIPKAAFSIVEPKTFSTLRNIHRQC